MPVNCPHCNAKSTHFLRARDVNRKITGETFDYHRCCDCGLVYLSPVPEDLGAYYGSNYPQYAIPASLEDLAARAGEVRSRIEIVQRWVSTGRLLEIGPSYGAFAFLAKRSGFEVEAVEMDPTCCTFLTNTVGVKCLSASDMAAALQDAKPYQVIALWHVIEHLRDVRKTVRLLAERLAPGGILVLSTPNPASAQFRVFGRFWVNLDAPRHLQLIPASVLIKDLEESGLKVAWATTTDSDGLAQNKWGWEASLMNLLASAVTVPAGGAKALFRAWKNGRSRPREANPTVAPVGFFALMKAVAIRSFVRLAGRGMAFFAMPIEQTSWRGNTYTLVFQKSER